MSAADTTAKPTDRPIPGWYADPRVEQQLRYWDGARWTDHTQPIVDTSRRPRIPDTVVNSTVSPREWSARQRRHVFTIAGAPLLAIAGLAFVLLGGLDRLGSDSPESIGAAPAETPTSTSPIDSAETTTSTTTTVAPGSSVEPSTSAVTTPDDFGVGVHEVGPDIAPGLYRVSLSWARLDAQMDVIDNDLTLTGVSLMTVLDTDAFVELSGTAVPIDEMPTLDPIGEGLTQGTYLVGADVEPGTYLVSAEPGATAFVARLGPNLEVIETTRHETSVVVELFESDFAVRYTGRIEKSP